MRIRLVLFDIDGTLLDCGGRTREPLAGALEATYGTCGTLLANGFAGKTDDQIVFESLAGSAVTEPEITAALPRVKERYLELLSEHLDGTAVRVLPGVETTLGRLAARGDVELGLLTGNWRLGAERKLALAGLGDRFTFGVYGDDSRSRDVLPPAALAAAARRFGRAFEPAEVLIVGDTENDVRCARACGMPVAGVATGVASRRELAAAGASYVYDDLREAGFLEPLLNGDRGG